MSVLSDIESCTTQEVFGSLTYLSDEAYSRFKDAKRTGDVEAAAVAWKKYSLVDDVRLQLGRALNAAKDVLA